MLPEDQAELRAMPPASAGEGASSAGAAGSAEGDAADHAEHPPPKRHKGGQAKRSSDDRGDPSAYELGRRKSRCNERGGAGSADAQSRAVGPSTAEEPGGSGTGQAVPGGSSDDKRDGRAEEDGGKTALAKEADRLRKTAAKKKLGACRRRAPRARSNRMVASEMPRASRVSGCIQIDTSPRRAPSACSEIPENGPRSAGSTFETSTRL